MHTARIENWNTNYSQVAGIVYDDKLGRFKDGTPITTSFIDNSKSEFKPGGLIYTKSGSVYLLGEGAD